MIPTDCVSPDDLPRTAREMADIIGLEATLKIVEAKGGIRLCVPRNTSEDHWLVDLVGKEAFEKLVYYYDGEEIDMPRCQLAFRRAGALRCFKAGMSVAKAARELGFTERGLRMLKQKLNELGRL